MALFALIGTIVLAIFSSLSHNNSKKTTDIQKEMNQQKIDVDIISKSRMHWMDNAKIITSDFITIALNLGANFNMFTEKVIQFNNINSRIIFLEKKGDSHLSKIVKEEYTELKNGIKMLNNEMQTMENMINKLLDCLAKNFLLIKLNFTKNVEQIYNRLPNIL